MKIERVVIKNFLKIGTAKINLADRGLVLIQGDNRDDSSATSNGSGKSSVVDAICWALYGTTARNVSGDAVVNRSARKDCSVTVEVNDGVNKYGIVRTRKPNSLSVFRDNADGTFAQLTKGTEKETQEVINRLMGCSLDVFTAAVYAGQEKMPDLPGMTDKQLKLMIEEAAGVEVLAAAYAAARHEATEALQTHDRVTLKVRVMEDAINASRVRLVVAKTDSEAWLKDFQTALDTYDNNLLFAKASIVTEEGMLKTLDEPAALKAKAQIQSSIDGLESENKTLAALTREHQNKSFILARAQSASIANKQSVDRAERNLAQVHSKIGSPCGTCGKKYEQHDIGEVEKHAKEALDAAKATLRASLISGLKPAKEAADAAEKSVNDFRLKMQDPSALLKKQGAINDDLSRIEVQKRNVKFAISNLKSLEESNARKAAEKNPHEARFNSEKIELASREATLVIQKQDLENATEELRICREASEVFGPAGVRAHILDTVTPFLNARTSEYLGALSDENISAVWSTLSTTAKGDLREKFVIDVTSAKDSESYEGLSGGEKRKVRLACALALQDLVATRATKPINLFIADEIDDALDEAGLERLMGVLERKARERGTVLVISHNSLSDWIDTVITVVKQGDVSRVEGETGA